MSGPHRLHPDHPVVEALEAKLLYSGDVAPLVAMGTTASLQAPLTEQVAQPEVVQARAEMVFIDASVDHLQSLLDDLNAQAQQGRALTVIVIDQNEDGIARITQALSQAHDLAAIHVISHGDEGLLHLGSQSVNQQTLTDRASEVAAWGSALSSNGDLLLYGCRVADQADGQALIQALSALTGTDVAASDDLTGAQALGGDWQLEVQTGQIEVSTALSAQAQLSWMGTLADATPTSSKGTALWADSSATTPQASAWDGLTQGTTGSTAVSGRWTVISSAASPNGQEAIVLGIDASGVLRGERWNGTQWQALPLNPMASGLSTDRQSFAVAYEQTSGKAMLVWNNGTTLKYSTFDGTVWSTAQTVAAYTGAEPQRMQIAAQPKGNSMVLIISDANVNDRALIWDGSSWGHAQVLDPNGGNTYEQLAVTAAYESQSGDAVVFYGRNGSNSVYYQVFNGTTWSGQQTSPLTTAAQPIMIVSASDPLSDRIAIGVVSLNTPFTYYPSVAVWSGSAWGNYLGGSGYNPSSTAGINIGVAFESQSGDLLATYGTSTSTPYYATLAKNATAWSGITTMNNLGAQTGVLKLYSDPASNHIMLAVQNINGGLNYFDWNGQAFAAPYNPTGNTGSSSSPAFTWLWQPSLSETSSNTLLLGSATNTTGWRGVNQVSGTEVLSLGDPGLKLDATASSGTFSHVWNPAVFGATGLDDVAWISQTVTLSSGLNLQRGDVVFTVVGTNTLSSNNSVTVNNDDVVVFRPQAAGDYSAGTFNVIIQALGSGALGLGSADVKGLAVVEQDTVFGEVTLLAGEILFTAGNGSSGRDVYLFSPDRSGLLGGLLLGNISPLLVGSEINLTKVISALELVTTATPMGGRTLAAGSLLMTLEQGTSFGSNTLQQVDANDVAIVTVQNTSLTSTAQVSVQVLLDGTTLGLPSSSFDTLAIELAPAPVITSLGGSNIGTTSTPENTTAVVTVTAIDAIGGNNITFGIDGGADAGLFQINSQSGVLTFKVAPDFETPSDADGNGIYDVVVSASDGTQADRQLIHVTVGNTDEAPEITSGLAGNTATVSATELNRLVTTITARDPESAVITFSLAGGADQALFEIDANTGVLSFITSPDTTQSPYLSHALSYQVVVAASDGSLVDTQALTVNLAKVNRPPVNSLPGSFTVAEDTVLTLSGLSVNDPDAGAGVVSVTLRVEQGTLSLAAPTSSGAGVTTTQLSNDGRQLTITGSAAAINSRLNQANALSYRPDLNYQGPDTLRMVSDDGGASGVPQNPAQTSDEDIATITVTAVNDAPTVGTSSGHSTYTENGTAVVVDAGLTLADVDGTVLTSARVVVTNPGPNGQDILDLTDTRGLSASWNASTAILTLSGTANLADYQAALRSVTYLNNSDNPAAPDRLIGFEVTDDSGTVTATSLAANRSVRVTAVNDAPAVDISSTPLVYTEGAGPVALDNTISLSDEDSPTLVGATVAITGQYVNTEDMLGAVNQNGITGQWNAGTGVLTLTGTATLAQYEAALRSVSYLNTSSDPHLADRTIAITINDGSANSPVATLLLSIVAVNDAPTVETTPGHNTYTENGAAVVVDAGLTLDDADSTALSSARVVITNPGPDGQDVLGLTDTRGLSTSWNASTSTLTLTGTASLADYQAALRSVTFVNTSDNPSAPDRIISFEASDSHVTNTAISTPANRTVRISAINDAPAVDTSATTQTYTEGATPVAVDPALSIADIDSTTLSGATIAITGQFVSTEDVLSFANQNGITGQWDANSGTLTLTGTATVAQYEAALRSVAYRNTSDDSSLDDRTITFTVNDGSANSPAATQLLSITSVNDAPTIDTTSGQSTYTENGETVVVDAALTLDDADSTSLSSARVVITNPGPNGQDILDLTDTRGLSTSWNASTSTLTLTGTASLADYQAALRSVTFVNTSDNPSAPDRIIAFEVSDDSATVTATSATANRTVRISAINDAPAVDTSATTQTYTEGATPVAVDPALSIADIDSTTLSGATIAITGQFVSTEDVLSFANQNGITGQWDANSGTLTLTGTATVAQYEAALRSVAYRNTSDDPSLDDRTITFTVNDGSANSPAATQLLSITPVNDAPTIDTTSGQSTYTENGETVVVDAALTLDDADSTSLSGARVVITNPGPDGQDVLGLTDTRGLSTSWNASTSTLTLTGTASLADYQAALRSVTFVNTSDNPSAPDRIIAFEVSDDSATVTATSATANRTVRISAINDAPAVDTSATTQTYTEGATPVAVDPALSIADIDSTTLSSATIAITSQFVNTEDVLSFANQNGITGQWDANSGTLTLNGTATVAQYEAALRSVTYLNISDQPSEQSRTVSIQLTDGQDSSSIRTVTVTVTGVNDAPTLGLTSGQPTYTENGQAVSVAPDITIGDVDSIMLTSATVRVSSGHVEAQDILLMPTQPGISSTWSPSTGTLQLTGTASLADYQAALRSITYANLSDNPAPGLRSISFSVDDGQAQSPTSLAVLRNVTVIAVNDVPAIVLNQLDVLQGGSARPVITVQDPDNQPEQLTVLVQGITAGQFVDLGTGQSVGSFTVAQLNRGDIVFVHDGSFATPDYQLLISDGELSAQAPAPVTQLRLPPPPTYTPTTTSSDTPNPADAGPAATETQPSASADSVAEPSVTPIGRESTPTTGLQDDATGPTAFDPTRILTGLTLPDITVSNPATRFAVDISSHVTWRANESAPVLDGFAYQWGGSLQAGPTADALSRNLQALQEQLLQANVSKQQVVATSIALSTGLSMGYVIWLVRGGALLGSMLSSMPLWNMIDPLPILNRAGGRSQGADGDDGDASVEDLFDTERASRPIPPEATKAGSTAEREGLA